MKPDTALNVPIARTSLLEEEIQSVLAPLRSGWLVQGPKVREFEQKWSNFTGAKHSIAVTSCTSALHLSLAALGFGPGDEAIVPAFTWIATANVVEHLGGKVVFCDIDLETFNLDVADAACGFGARIHGQHVGNMGDTGCFSFHPRKAITTGEGGMITTESDDLAERLRRLRDHGAATSDLQRHLGPRPYQLADHPDAGYNQRMTDLQAALGSAQMDRAATVVAERQRLARVYEEAFGDLSWLRTPPDIADMEHGFQSYACLFQPEPIASASIARINAARNAFMDELHNAGIATRPATHAVHMLSFYREKYGLAPEDFPRAYAANDCSVSLPLFQGMTETEQAHVIEHVLSFQP